MDLANKHLTSGELGKVLSKQVIVLRLANAVVRKSALDICIILTYFDEDKPPAHIT